MVILLLLSVDPAIMHCTLTLSELEKVNLQTLRESSAVKVQVTLKAN